MLSFSLFKPFICIGTVFPGAAVFGDALRSCRVIVIRLNDGCVALSGKEAERHDRGEEVGRGARPEGTALAEAGVSGGCEATGPPGSEGSLPGFTVPTGQKC